MDIVIVADYCRKFDGQTNNRFLFLADKLCKKHNVEVISSDFEHQNKKYFSKICYEKYKFKITLLHEPSYDTNICLKRFYSHFEWGLRVFKYLRKRKKADVIYCAVPTLTTGYLVAHYCKKEGIKFIIDVQDLWPEAYKMVFNWPIISDIVFAPFYFLANSIYSSADDIIAVSQTYVNRALSVNRKIKKGHAVFLGTKLFEFDLNKNNENTNITDLLRMKKDNLWLVYCGMLGNSYDLKCVIDSLAILKDKGITPPVFVVMGDGPKRNDFEKYSKERKIECLFLGNLEYSKMCKIICMCDITVNSINPNASPSIINKHSDYAASGLPTVNNQKCVEYRNLIDQYHMGLNCKSGDPNDMANKLEILIKDENLREQMGQNARKCAVDKFDKDITYNEIINVILDSEM